MDQKEIPYIRIGINYYKFIYKPLYSGDTIKKIVPWNKATITLDHGANILSKIPKYDCYTVIPDNINYKRVHGKEKGNEFRNGAYNLYEPISFKPKKGSFKETEFFLKHIFGEQYDLGLDYLTIIFKYPTQILPILCLVSSSRNTGKTTYLNWLKLIFGENMTINTDEDFRSNFNSGWSTKLIIGGEEISLNKKEDLEKLKNLSTAKTIKSEAKGKDKTETEFFGKIILCSNNVDDFIKIDHNEIRFWVRDIPTIKKEIPNYEQDYLKKEIPAFLYFLLTREIKNERQTRQWFTREQLYTKALQRVINGSTSQLEREMKELIIDELISFNIDEISLTPKDIINKLADNNFRTSLTPVIEVLKKWNKEPLEKTGRYYLYWLSNAGNIQTESRVGRFYTFKKIDFIK